MIGDVIHPLNTTLFGPAVYEVISEMSPIVRLSSLWGAMSPQEFVFETQDSVPGGGVGDRICFQPASRCFYNCKHMALALVGLWECDIVNLPGLPIFIFQPSSPIPQRLYPLRLLDCSTLHIRA